ncbi:unnamed protein product, partial [Mycena citricolor]
EQGALVKLEMLSKTHSIKGVDVVHLVREEIRIVLDHKYFHGSGRQRDSVTSEHSQMAAATTMSSNYFAKPELDTGVLHTLGTEEYRRHLLCDYQDTIEDQEQATQILLKAFDLDLHDSPLLSNPASRRETRELNTPPDLSETQHTGSQNPFLSTPMRMKHFSKLSPSILRDLLRSPSLRNSSFDNENSLDSIPRSTPEASDLAAAVAFNARSTDTMPLTPPPTARLPFTERLADSSIDFIEEIASMYLNDLPSPLACKPAPCHIQVSPTTVRHFQKVIDEMRGVDVRQVLQIEEQESVVEQTSIAEEGKMGTLEKEFVGLLHERAIEDESEAITLRSLADRLERMAHARRRLAGTMEAQVSN